MANRELAAREPRFRAGREDSDGKPDRSPDRAGLARRQGQQVIYTRNLLETLRRHELESAADIITSQTGMPFGRSASAENVAGLYRPRLMLASGRFAMIDDGLGFQLVPWSPSLERNIGKHVSGVTRADGGTNWSFGKRRGLGL